MTLTVVRPLPALLLVFVLAAAPSATLAGQNVQRKPADRTTTAERASLYSPRVRRSTISYLRLRLLELREEGLERARAAIERRLSIDDLIYGHGAGAPAREPEIRP